ncbi:hypothetical protein PIB30_011883 [Stylosanthes scabra]|uniref:Verticillium wilt resistance-like protein n=1 Tax=Stylosanthes scabra TaxID=79078 RepID=A0ABU6U8T0_9FABA|nr:hypothetical protein [Stylosanthes scabra]
MGPVSSNHFEGLRNLVNIDLGDNSLDGRVPSSLFNLPYLQLLSISNNRFDGQLDEFPNSSFSSLEMLDLSGNNLQGPIPFSIFQLKRLTFLELSTNKFNGTIQLSLIRSLQNLKTLDLSQNNLTVVASAMEDNDLPFPKLQNLWLDSCKLGTFPSFLRNQTSLLYLDLSNNQIEGIIPNWIWRFDFLTSLNLSHNFLTNLEGPFQNLSSTLYYLNLHENQLQGPAPIFTKNIALLDYSNNRFSSIIAPGGLDLSGNLLKGTIPKSLANCQKLQVLNVRNNQLKGEFPCLLKNISTLSVLVLRSNKLYGEIECSNVIGNWERLQIVDVADNNFSGKLPTKLFQSWKALMSDEDISRFDHLSFDIYDSNISPVNFAFATTILTKTSKMELAKIVAAEPFFVVDHLLSHVYGDVSSLRRYEASVTIVIKGQQMKLEKILIAFTSLDFSSNRFEGPIPEEMMSFKALHALNLSHNSFSGHIASTLGNLRNLESLDLSVNSLRGEIPTELASLSFLSIMNLSYNHLVGRIPTGTQIQSFEADSFMGNEGLCGPPLTQDCGGGGGQGPSRHPSSKRSSIDWSLLSVELGFTFGFGIIIMPLILCQKWRLWYSKQVEDVLYKIVPQLDFVYETRGGKRYRSLKWKPY